MTDKEIIEALKRCSLHSECCYCNSVEECGNKRVLTASVLDLINHLKTKCNKYLNKVQAQKGELARLYKQNAEYKAEIERLQEKLEAVEDYLRPLPFATVFDERIEREKADAIKDFAKRLKDVPSLIIAGQKHYVIVESYFDNLIKEMVGDVE